MRKKKHKKTKKRINPVADAMETEDLIKNLYIEDVSLKVEDVPVDAQNIKSGRKEKLGKIISFFLDTIMFLVLSFVFFYPFVSDFQRLSLYTKDKAFLENAKETTAYVIKRISITNKNNYTEYSFSCGKYCHEDYQIGNIAKVRYEVDGQEYENNLQAVFYHSRTFSKSSWLPFVWSESILPIYYNVKDPYDIRHRDDLIIRELRNSGNKIPSRRKFDLFIDSLLGLVGVVVIVVGIFFTCSAVFKKKDD